jgi:hypothetical protein
VNGETSIQQYNLANKATAADIRKISGCLLESWRKGLKQDSGEADDRSDSLAIGYPLKLGL